MVAGVSDHAGLRRNQGQRPILRADCREVKKNAWGKSERVIKRRLAATKRSEQGATERSRVPSPIASRLEDTTGDGKRKFELLLQALLPEVFS
jgi:hypothetical protein